MKLKNIYLILAILVGFIYMLSGSLMAGGWTDQVPPLQNEWINDVFSNNSGSQDIYAVGDNGYVGYSNNGGFGFMQIPISSTDRLKAVDIFYDLGDTTVFVVGEAGSIFRIRQNTFFDENRPVPENFHTVSVNANRVWIAGDNGQIFYSDDKGDSWLPGTINGNPVNFTRLIPTTYGMYACGFWNTKSYILSDENNDTVFDIVDSLDNVILSSAFTDFGRLYFAGENLGGGTGAIAYMDDIVGTFGPLTPFFPPEVDSPITDITGTFDSIEKIWVSTTNGFIHLSDRDLNFFTPDYQNMEGKSIHTLSLILGSVPPVVLAAGSDGLMARYDFMANNMSPFINDFSYPGQNSFQIGFTTVTDLTSIQNGMYIHSSVSGLIPFTAAYFPGDSTIIDIFLQEGGSVPGETWTIILTNMIQENITLFPLDKTFNYQVFAISGGGQNFLNVAQTPVYNVGRKTSNFVSGFFTEDDIFDLVTITSDSVFLFPGKPGGETGPVLGELLPAPLSLDSGIPDQIRTMDINLDGMLDLVIFDDKTVQLLIKEPDAMPNLFRPGAQFAANNINDIEIHSADQDASLDIAILNDSLQSRINVNEFSFGFPMFSEADVLWDNFEIRDMDGDAFQDFVGLTKGGDIILRHMVAWQGFDNETMIPGPFDKFVLADIDDDRQMEVLAQQFDIIRVFHKDIDWNFSEIGVITQGSPDTITTFVVHDFNNDRFLDVAVTTPGKTFKVFQNTGATFSERFDVERIIQVEPTGLIHGDFDMDATLDLVAYDSDNGEFEILRNLPGPGGQVQNLAGFDSLEVTGTSVYLQWKEFDPIGDLDFYNIYRGSDSTTMSLLTSTTTNFFVDSTVSPGNIYWYRIEALDVFVQTHPVTSDLQVIVPYELSGSLSGVLSDTLFPYLVTGAIEVKQDSSLTISEGVELLFEPDIGFTVYGSLDVQGSEQNMVDFKANHFGQPWAGITISGIVNTDTVRFNWFDIGGAIEGMRIENRPVCLTFGGIVENQMGFNVLFPNGFLKAENIIIHSNEIGIQTSSNSIADLKNVTIVANKKEGIDIYDNSQVKVKNAIIYHNNKDDFFSDFKNGADIRNQSTIDLDIKYSSVDSIEGKYNGFELNPVPPLFQPVFPDSMEFVPDSMSATIDAGDPLDDFSLEPKPNGGRINQGVYGGSPFAMPTFQPRIAVKIDTLFMSAFPGETNTKDLVIHNTGNRVLEIFNLELHIPEFVHSDAVPLFIPPGDSTLVKINFLPNNRQPYFDEIFIRCNDPHFPPEGLILPIRGIGLNRPPTITSVNLLNAVQDMAYVDTIRAFDPDGDKITFLPIAMPVWLKIETDGGISGTPGNQHVGKGFKVEILAVDDMGDSDTLLTFIDVANVNDPPQITTNSLDDATEDIAYVDTVFAVDIDMDTLNFYAINIPGWMKLQANGAISGVPLNEDVTDRMLIEIGVTDRFGLDDTLTTSIRVINTNDAPILQSIPDTMAYAFLPFTYKVSAIDVDGDSLSYSDDTPLFDIDSKTGLINYTPGLADTGNYIIKLSINDGQVSVTDSFRFAVELTPVLAAPVPQATSRDQALVLEWKNTFSSFYTGTRIVWSKIAPVKNPDNAINFIDTTYALDVSVQAVLKNLDIARTYYITIFNYFEPGIRIYSDPVEVVAKTLEPNLTFDFSDRIEHVPPGDTLFTSLHLKNDGGGTLVFKFRYIPDIALDDWFAADTSQYILAPGDSTNINYQMHPLKSMAERPHEVVLQLWTNQPNALVSPIKLTMNILFDHDAPEIIMISHPDTVHKYSALRFEFTANDTVENYGWKYGFPTKDLRARYLFERISTSGNVEIKKEENVRLGSIDIFPLPDGLYHMQIYVYDPDYNGKYLKPFEQHLVVNSSVTPILRNSWYLASFPREQDIDLNKFVTDSSALVFRWDNQNNKYISFTDSVLKAGQGVWILSFKPRKFDLSGFSVSTADHDSTHLLLKKGWNQIGVPSGYHLNLADLKFLNPGTETEISRDVVFSNYLSPAIYWYQSSNLQSGYKWSMIDSTIVSPWLGYWVYANQEVTIVYSRIPAFPKSVNRQVSDREVLIPGNLTKKSVTANDWKLSLNVTNERHNDPGNFIGISESNTELPVYEPPHLDEYCSAYFSAPDGKITQDLRQPFADLREIKEWQLNVSSSNTGKKHTINWQRWSEESGIYLYLVDQVHEKVINLSEENSYVFTLSSENYQFKVYATMDASFSPKIIPVTYKLLQNYPNPFNPSTTIKFGIPESGDNKLVSLKIFNILGQEVSTLLNGNMKAGYHEVKWNGLNQHGFQVASGVYFYRLLGEGIHQVKKMVLIR
jgi:hypothetical protein